MIELKNVTKNFETFTALDDITLKIPKGRTYGLVGANGAGKSTILRLLCGVYKQEDGEVTVDGEKIFDCESAKQKMFFINDETVQFQTFTLRGLKDYYKCFYPKFSEEMFETLRQKIQLPLDKKISQFSKGMKRQSIVIVALACNTDYLLLDEAFDGLDPAMRLIVKKMVYDSMLDRELTLVISSHNLGELNELCDSVAMIHKGKVLFEKELDSVKGDVHKIQLVFKGVEYNKDNFSGLQLLHFDRTGSIYNLIVKGTEEEINAEIQPKNPLAFEILPLTLEEIFIYELEVLGYDSSGIQTAVEQ